MDIELITSVDHLEGSSYFELQPGPYLGDHWCPDSVYLHMYVFDLVSDVFMDQLPEFAYFGTTTISGRRIEKLAKALDEFAAVVNKADTPDAIWKQIAGTFIENLSDELEDRTTGKRQLSIMLRKLSQWMRGVAALNEPVTILGI